MDFRMTGGGSLALGSNWLRGFDDVFREGCEAVGLIFRKLTASTTPAAVGTYNCQFIVGANYKDGTVAVFRNTSRRNRKNDVAPNADGSPGVRRMNIEGRSITPASVNGTVSGSIPLDAGNTVGGTQPFLEVRDTSRAPAGNPEIDIVLRQDDLVSVSPGVLIKDDTFSIRVLVRNAIPGTQIRMLAAGEPKPFDGQYMIEEDFRTEIARAARAAGCTVFIPRWTPATAGEWFNGGIITLPDTVPANFSIDMRFRVNTDPDMEEKKIFYVFSRIQVEGDISDFTKVTNKGDYVAGGTYSRGDYLIRH